MKDPLSQIMEDNPGSDIEVTPQGHFRIKGERFLRVTNPHIWDVNGRRRGTSHEMVLRGNELTISEIGLDEGVPMDVGKLSVTMPFLDAVHVLMNMSPEERSQFAHDRVGPPRSDSEDDGA